MTTRTKRNLRDSFSDERPKTKPTKQTNKRKEDVVVIPRHPILVLLVHMGKFLLKLTLVLLRVLAVVMVGFGRVLRASFKSQAPGHKLLWRYFPVWATLTAIFLLIVLPQLASFALGAINRIPRGFSGPGIIAPLFTTEVEYWADDIVRWANAYDLDPNLLATVMQIESCGHPTVASYAGAQGLFQVMPFHFESTENQLDPDTNANRGGSFLRYCLDAADGNTGMAMACYNGGPSVLSKDFTHWSSQTRRYYIWGSGIYRDAQADSSSSHILDEWLNAGGKGLCRMASDELGLR